MDMFYAAIEMRDRPHLAEKPIAIGPQYSPHYTNTILSTSNYIARSYGV